MSNQRVATMADTGPRRYGIGFDVKPHAYDPAANPELFEGVLARRLIAFLIDVVIIALPMVFIGLFIFLFGLVTFGLGWTLYFLFYPACILWALIYYGVTLGGSHSATAGMRLMDIEMRTWYGAPAYFVLGAVHAVIYWVTVSLLTPLVLVVGLLNDRRRLLHDIVVGAIIINNPYRAEAMRRAWSRP
jgi:uncharacterized RDD family membrane protein YckC